MPASALGQIGEPMHLDRDEGLTLATYPLPFEQRLDVTYDEAGTIVWINTSAWPDAPLPPQGDGLRIGRMTLGDVERYLGGRRAAAIETPGLAVPTLIGPTFSLIYDHSDDPDLVIRLAFVQPGYLTWAEDDPASHAPPRDATLMAATLALRSYYDPASGRIPFPDGPRTVPIPFPLPIDEAFPSLIP
jgi:hypothetical protein